MACYQLVELGADLLPGERSGREAGVIRHKRLTALELHRHPAQELGGVAGRLPIQKSHQRRPVVYCDLQSQLGCHQLGCHYPISLSLASSIAGCQTQLPELVLRVLAFVVGRDPGIDRYPHNLSPVVEKG
jgi:hypothetical protein